MQVTRFVPAAATATELEGYFGVRLASQTADRPNDPPPTKESTIGWLTGPVPPKRRFGHWVVRDGERIAGTGLLILFEDENTDVAAVDVEIHPAFRRRGGGTALLRELANAASGRKLLLIEGLAEGGAGAAWAEAFGFAVVQRTARQTLNLTTVDRSRWAIPTSKGYQLARWRGSVPEQFLGSYARARNAIHDAPLGDMAFTMPAWTPERVRELEAGARARGCERRVVAAIADETGEVAGLTDLEVHPRQPTIAVQQDTSVVPAHRGRRLGLWMKAENLHWLVAEHPQIQFVRTTTAADNQHMLRVNHHLGFSLDLATQNRQVPLSDLIARLA